MPKINGQGLSEFTELKEKTFYDLFKQHLATVNAICKKQRWDDKKYIYIDATAGSGWNAGNKGSPIQFWDAVNSFKSPLHFKIKAFFIEQNENILNNLRDNISPRCQRNSVFIHGDYSNCISSVLKNEGSNFGILCIDPNGIIEFDPLKEIINTTRYLKVMEVILYLSATSIKRVRSVHYTINELAADIKTIKKNKWFVSDYWGANQWAFFIGTNSKSFVPHSNGTRFHDISSPMGERIFHRLNFTKKEYRSNLPGQRNLDEILDDFKKRLRGGN